MKMQIPNSVKIIMDKISSRNANVFIVGGAVRDSVIGKQNDDYDLCTDLPLEEVKELFPNFVIMKENDHRNTGTIRVDNLEIEISTIRGNSIQEDLSKRDFTINTLISDKDGNIIDYFGGIDDIYNKRISLVNKEGNGIVNDPIRILRALRLQEQLDFSIDEETQKIINEKALLLNLAAPERILKELFKIFKAKDTASIIRNNKKVFCAIIPELESTINFEQNNNYHIYDVFEHTLKVVENVPYDNVELKIAALFHDIGKPLKYSIDENGVGHFYNHDKASADIFHSFAKKFRMNKDMARRISKLIEYHDRVLPTKSVSIRKFLMEYGIEGIQQLFDLKEADIKAQNPIYSSRLVDLEKTKQLFKEVIDRKGCLSIKDLNINGRVLMKMGFYDKEIGIILKDLLNQVTEEIIPNEEVELTEYVSNKYR